MRRHSDSASETLLTASSSGVGVQRYWTRLVEGNVRVYLTGAITGVVTAVEAEYGASQVLDPVTI
jgi:sRNA-binding protein